MSYQTLILEKGEIAKITLNRPEKLNALNQQLKNELVSAINEVKRDPNTRVVIFKGAGRAFCAGQDITETVFFKAEHAKGWIRGYDRLYNAIRSIDVPAIASIKGYAVGAGFQIALLMDIRIAAEDAKIGMTEIDVGIPCITGSQCLLMAGMPFSKVVELIFTGDLIEAKEAEKLGIINKTVPADKLDEETEEMAKKIASKPPVAESINKSWFRKLTSKMMQEAIEFAAEAYTKAYASGEPQKAMEAFLKKRKRK